MNDRLLMDEIEAITRRVPLLGAESDRIAYLVSPEEWHQLEQELALLQLRTDDAPDGPPKFDKIKINYVEVRRR